MLQITFTSEQLSWLRTGIGWISTVVTIWGLVNKAYSKVIDTLHVVITENINRAIKETTKYADEKFSTHESSAFKRLDAQDIVINNLIEEIKKINAKFN